MAHPPSPEFSSTARSPSPESTSMAYSPSPRSTSMSCSPSKSTSMAHTPPPPRSSFSSTASMTHSPIHPRSSFSSAASMATSITSCDGDGEYFRIFLIQTAKGPLADTNQTSVSYVILPRAVTPFARSASRVAARWMLIFRR
jgi:hypothetical protein